MFDTIRMYINRLHRLAAKNDRQACTKKNTYDTALRPRYSVYTIHVRLNIFKLSWFRC